MLEHYQDAYVLHRRFFGSERFQNDWESVNVAAAAAVHFQKTSSKRYWFLVSRAREFYGFTKSFDEALEMDKYKFFTSNNWVIDVNSYYESTVPSRSQMEGCEKLVQGGRFDKKGAIVGSGLFDHYLDRAVAQTQSFWREVETYLAAPQTNFNDEELTPDKRSFRTLRRHWNLDCGLAPDAEAAAKSWEVPDVEDTRVHIGGSLEFAAPSNSGKMKDVVP